MLRAFGANSGADFSRFIYAISTPLVAPFAGLFGNPQSSGGVLELHSIVALIVYALLAWLLTRLAWLVFGDTRSAMRTASTSVETKA